jgi:hypothetical protein
VHKLLEMKTKTPQPPFVNFYVAPLYRDRDGHWETRSIPSSSFDPTFKQPPKRAFQITLLGSREHYLQLAEFLRKFAELDTSHDDEYHEHYDGLLSIIGNVRLHLILRKDDVGTSIWHPLFPKPIKKKRKAKSK